MTAYDKLRSIVFTITTAVLFFLWTLLMEVSSENLYLNVLIGAVASLGTYRIILKILETVFLRIHFIKKIILGASYLDGIWIGAYIGDDLKPRYYKECFEQDFNGLIIRGSCYHENFAYKGQWVSDQVYINEKNGTITYTYTTDMIKNNAKNQGLASFNFCRKNKREYPKKMIGFSSDIFSTKKFLSYEWKLNKDEMQLSDEELLKLAKERYQEERNKEHNI